MNQGDGGAKKTRWTWLRKTALSRENGPVKITNIKSVCLFFGSVLTIGVFIVTGSLLVALLNIFCNKTIGVGDFEQGAAAFFAGLAFLYLVVTYEHQKIELRLTRKQLRLSRSELASTSKSMKEQVQISSINSVLQTIPVLIRLEVDKVSKNEYWEKYIGETQVPGQEIIKSALKLAGNEIERLAAVKFWCEKGLKQSAATGVVDDETTKKLYELVPRIEDHNRGPASIQIFLDAEIETSSLLTEKCGLLIFSLKKILNHQLQLDKSYILLLEKSGCSHVDVFFTDMSAS